MTSFDEKDSESMLRDMMSMDNIACIQHPLYCGTASPSPTASYRNKGPPCKRVRLDPWWNRQSEENQQSPSLNSAEIAISDCDGLLEGDEGDYSYAASDVTSDAQDITEALPDDLLAKCFFNGYLNSLDVIQSLSCVNKKLRQVAQSTVKLLDLRSCQSLSPSDASNLVCRFQNLSEIDFSYCRQFSDRHLLSLIPLTPTLRILLLRGTTVTDSGFAGYFKAMAKSSSPGSRLEVLDLSTVRKCDSEERRITDETVLLLTEKCPNLESLSLDWCRGVTDVSCRALIKLLRLHTLSLFLTSITETGCCDLAKLRSLYSLDVSATPIASVAAVTHSLSSRSTKNAQDSGDTPGGERERGTMTHKETPDDSHGIGNLFPRRQESPLHELRIRFVQHLTEETLIRIANHAPSLKLLDLRHSEFVASTSPSSTARTVTTTTTPISREVFRMLQRRGVEILATGCATAMRAIAS